MRDITRPQNLQGTYQWWSTLGTSLSKDIADSVIHCDIDIVYRLYRSTNLEPTIDNWPRLFHEPTQALEEQLLSRVGDATVVGYEIAPSMVTVLKEHAIPFLNFELHPIRFLNDVYFSVETNIPSLKQYMQPFAISEDAVYSQAALLKATLCSNEPILNEKHVFIGQTEIDRSLIHGARFARLDDFTADLPSDLIFKPHPYAQVPPPAQYTTTRANVYEILASNAPPSIYSISSSVIEEAKYFGVTATRLLPPKTIWPALNHPYLQRPFWQAIFQPVDSPAVIQHAPNTLRLSLRQFWGYEEIHYDYLKNLIINHSKFPWNEVSGLLFKHIKNRLSKQLRKKLGLK